MLGAFQSPEIGAVTAIRWLRFKCIGFIFGGTPLGRPLARLAECVFIMVACLASCASQLSCVGAALADLATGLPGHLAPGPSVRPIQSVRRNAEEGNVRVRAAKSG